jgi:hypothetical protein
MSKTGFEQTLQGLVITKDPEAKLTYALDWSEWLPTGDSLSSSTWQIVSRINDPTPLIKVSNGIQGTKTYIQLDNGQGGKTYTLYVKIITVDGLEDRRFFKVKVADRSA